MTTWFDYVRQEKAMGDVIEFEPGKRQIEHVDSTTIVERIEFTPELKAEFETMGYTIKEEETS